MTDTDVIADLLKAVKFAADRHRDQRRKDEEASPYVNHPIAVAEVLARHGVRDRVTLLAAVLHDTLEDTETEPHELESAFDAGVRRVVEEVTDDKGLPKDVRKRRQVETAPGLSDEAKLVRIADKVANVTDVMESPPRDWPLERRRGYLEWTSDVIEGCRGVNGALEAHYRGLLAEGRERLRAAAP